MKKSRQGTDMTVRAVLDDSPSHLLHRVLQIALDIYNEEAGEGALTQRQYAVLKALDGADGGLSQTDLVRLTGIDRSTLADLVARMMTKSLLKRERSATDARANLVQLDEAGRSALEDMQPRVMAADERILSLLSPPKRESFVKLLRKVTTAREEELSSASHEVVALRRERAAAAKVEKATQKAEKKALKKEHKKTHRKDDAKKLAKKLKKLPMPALSDGAVGQDTEEHVVAPVAVKA